MIIGPSNGQPNRGEVSDDVPILALPTSKLPDGLGLDEYGEELDLLHEQPTDRASVDSPVGYLIDLITLVFVITGGWSREYNLVGSVR
jgi:hypothetical protein